MDNARCEPIFEENNDLNAPRREAEVRFNADLALAMLRDAVDKGFQNVDLLKQDKYIGATREHEEIKKVVGELKMTLKKN